jgi:hypothetical protein
MSKFALFGAAAGVLGLSVLFACSSDPAALGAEEEEEEETDAGGKREGSVYDSQPSPESGLGELLFRPSNVYTGRDGTHTFKIPVAVYDSDADLTVTADDPSALTLAPATLTNPVSPDGVVDNGKYYMITALKAGTYTLTAASKGRSVTASVTVTDYAATRYQTGDDRYHNGVNTETADRACANCHQQGLAIDHSPAALATATDQEVGIIISTGVKPGPTVIKIPMKPGLQHKWTADDPTKDGLITYLRALNPRGFE